VFAVVMAVAFRLLAPLEHRRLPWWDAPVGTSGTRATAAGALVCVAGIALLLLARNGLGDVAGGTELGCFLAAVGAARLSATGLRRWHRSQPPFSVPTANAQSPRAL
jgi:hypothetical protein